MVKAIVIKENDKVKFVAQVKEYSSKEYLEICHKYAKDELERQKAKEEEEKKISEHLTNIDHAIEKIGNYIKSLDKSKFINVFTLFELKALKGEIDIEDESLLDLDTKVLNNTLSVEEALEKHPFLKETFEKLYSEKGE